MSPLHESHRTCLSVLLERNKRGCNKRGYKSNKCGNIQNLPDLREIGRICAKFAQKLRNFAQTCNIYANLREIYGPVCYGTVCSYLTKLRARGPKARLHGSRQPPPRRARTRKTHVHFMRSVSYLCDFLPLRNFAEFRPAWADRLT